MGLFRPHLECQQNDRMMNTVAVSYWQGAAARYGIVCTRIGPSAVDQACKVTDRFRLNAGARGGQLYGGPPRAQSAAVRGIQLGCPMQK